MKKKNLYILSLIALIPIVASFIMNSLYNKSEYFFENEKGNIREFGSVELIGTDYDKGKEILLNSNGIEVKNDDTWKYGSLPYDMIKEDKSFYRGKNNYDSKFFSENNDYLAFACVEYNNNNDSYIDLLIKDKSTGKVKEYKYNLHDNYGTYKVKIVGGFVNVILDKFDDKRSVVNYKFDCATGSFLKKFKIDNGDITSIMQKDIKDSMYFRSCNVNIDELDKDDLKNQEVSILKYNYMTDTIKEYKLPRGSYIDYIQEYNGETYLFDSGNNVLLKLDGDEFKQCFKLEDTNLTGINVANIKDNKVYFNCREYDEDSVNNKRESIVIVSLDSGKVLYSGDITRTEFLGENKTPVSLDLIGR